jgi:hypothetical protein
MNMSLSPVTRWLVGVCLGWLLICGVAVADPDFDPPGRVARINLAEGPVSVQASGANQWTDDVANRPLTSGDRVWADQNARAELHIGSAAVRLGAETGISLGNVDDQSVRIQLNAGALQFRVRALGPDETFEITTPFATVAVLSPGSYRLDVTPRGDELRVAVLQGQLAVTDSYGAATVDAGRQTRFHGAVSAAEPERLSGADALDQWAFERDRREDRSVSTRYVSRDVIGYEDLDDYGTWQVAGDYGPIWRPNVSADWSPYRNGHWIWVAPWGWTWVDDAPWGFAPFHYGRWLNVNGAWCWAPGPRHGRPYYAPALVGWVGGFGVGVSVGGPPVAWFPLGWNEVYVPSYRSSRNYVQNVNITNINVTNVVINERYDRARGGERRDDQRDSAHEYRNYGVTGAVVSTTRGAFATGQPVHSHPAEVPHFDHPRFDYAAPSVAPTPASFGRPAAIAPRHDVFTRPVMGSGNPASAPVDSGRPDLRVQPGHVPDYRPTPAAPTAAPTVENRAQPLRNEWRPNPMPTTPDNRIPTPRPEWRPNPGASAPDGAPGATVPAYRPTPSANPTPPPVAPENRYTPPRPDWRPSAPPEPTPQPSAPPRNEWRPTPETAPAPPPRPDINRMPEYRPAPPAARDDAPRPVEWHPAPAAPPPPPPPVMREYHPPAPPPAAPAPAPAPRPAPPPPAKEDRRDHPH